jgi:hypothetical protein
MIISMVIWSNHNRPFRQPHRIDLQAKPFKLNFWKYHLSTLSRNMHRKWPSLFYLKKKEKKSVQIESKFSTTTTICLELKKTSEGVKPTNIYPSKNIMHIFSNPITHETITQLKLRVFVFCFFLSVSHS